MIKSFKGKYEFLSNFATCRVVYNGVLYPTVEHAYQAAKCLHDEDRKVFRFIDTPGEAKRWGRVVTLRPDWESVKLSIMEDLVRQKFRNERLRKLLLETAGEELVEGNTWKDTFWGVCNGVGENNLGKILMKIREEILNDSVN